MSISKKIGQQHKWQYIGGFFDDRIITSNIEIPYPIRSYDLNIYEKTEKSVKKLTT